MSEFLLKPIGINDLSHVTPPGDARRMRPVGYRNRRMNPDGSSDKLRGQNVLIDLPNSPDGMKFSIPAAAIK
ncbi:hypothetical protein [Burkholderia vietnamiensis]|uniref:hypothetical protein n=1 Tax=Burkholderia vietnamiensis TaxID=60552 RepID=UPI0012D99EDE|nr:hypothetical protein [Burkholderia vietnamiensis]